MITNQGTDVAIALDQGQSLVDGAVLFLDDVRAIVVRLTEQEWLRIIPRDLDAALETGYCIGNGGYGSNLRWCLSRWKVRQVTTRCALLI